MWNTVVSTANNLTGHLQFGVSEAAASHPLMIVAAAALGVALLLTVWAETQAREIEMLRDLAEAARVTRARR